MPKKTTPSFILELGLEVKAHEEAKLNKRFSAARQLYNACLNEAKRRLLLLRQSKEYQHARSMPKTISGKPNKERTEAFKVLDAQFSFSEYDLHTYAAKIRNSWILNHIDSATSQKLATRAFKAVQRVAVGQAKRVRFKGKILTEQLSLLSLRRIKRHGTNQNVILKPKPNLLSFNEKKLLIAKHYMAISSTVF